MYIFASIWLIIGIVSIAYMIYEEGIILDDVPVAFFGIFSGPIALAIIVYHYIKHYLPSDNFGNKVLIRPRNERK